MLRILIGCFLLLPWQVVAQPAVQRPVAVPRKVVRERTPPPIPDATEHLKVVAAFDGTEATDIVITRGEGPPRAYLSERSDLVILLRGRDGQVLSRTPLPDPLEIRVIEIVRPAEVKTRIVPRPTTQDRVIRLKSTELTLFLPFPAGAAKIEFRQKDANGPLLGSARIPDFR